MTITCYRLNDIHCNTTKSTKQLVKSMFFFLGNKHESMDLRFLIITSNNAKGQNKPHLKLTKKISKNAG